MKIRITSKKRNPLLKRREVVFEVDHKETGSTPPRLEVRKELAALLKSDLELVYVKRMVTKTGMMVAVGEANAYDSIEDARLVEPKYIIARNMPPERPVEEAAEKPVEEKGKVKEAKEKPAVEKEERVEEPAEKHAEEKEKKGKESVEKLEEEKGEGSE